jgi:hypothetical protein
MFEVRLHRIEEHSDEDWVGQPVRLEIYIDDEPRDTLQQTLERRETWNLGDTSYRFIDHIQLQLLSGDGRGGDVELATFTIPAGATDPEGAQFEVAGDHGTFVLTYNVQQVESPGVVGAA